LLTDTGRVPFRYYAMMVGLDIRRPWPDRHWAGTAAAAADHCKALNERHDGSPSAHGHLFVACRALRERLHQLRLDLGRLDKSSSEELP
jgi:hypothetical protein